ncbi:MAG: 16S rRNA (guanine(527)-N(7))-methyltransferase RsmG [Clostridiales Family XIII bacterium]|jgi:16S rRNA (guanine527-N7)-methyltransferase|nr:16S rRNA (guanine(527)-N(7))-methyltransferase RsmG [Clostridiales Family XIII bacterium]
MKILLQECLNALNIKISDKYIDTLIYFWDILINYNKSINLISRNLVNKNGFITHIVDSLCPMVFSWPGLLTYLDLGSGGGLPAIPLKIINPSWKAYLIDSTGKKVDFLKLVGQRLKLDDFKVLNLFLKSTTILPESRFNLITTRGFASLDKTLPLISPFLSKGDHFLAFKGPKAHEELRAAKTKLQKYSLTLVELKEFTLPYIEVDRKLLLFEKF